MQAHGRLCGFQISEKRKKERKSWRSPGPPMKLKFATNQTGAASQEGGRTRGEILSLHNSIRKYFACKVEKGRDVQKTIELSR